MPLYQFHNTETDEYFEDFFSFSDRENYLKENPHIKAVVGSPGIVSGVNMSHKLDDGFKDVLKRIKSHHRGSNIETW